MSARKLRVNKPYEALIGANRGVCRLKVGNIHVGASYLSAVRKVMGGLKNRKKVPRALRRGLIACVIEAHGENRAVYNAAMTANLPVIEV